MTTSKNRVQGYISDVAYKYLEDFRKEHRLKSNSLALEKILELMAGERVKGDFLSESRIELKDELKSELKDELKKELKDELLSELKEGVTSESVSESISKSVNESLFQVEDIRMKALEETYVIVKAGKGKYGHLKVYLWDKKRGRFSPNDGTVYRFKDEVKTTVKRMQGRGKVDGIKCISSVDLIGEMRSIEMQEELIGRLYKLTKK